MKIGLILTGGSTRGSVDLARRAEKAGLDYATTVGRKHEYWTDLGLPGATKDIAQLRCDLYQWGYCLIDEGLSEAQCAYMRQRLEEQAEGERVAGLAHMTPSFQILWTLINKGECFARCVEHDPSLEIIDATISPRHGDQRVKRQHDQDIGLEAQLFQPLRCALTGKAGGPDLFDVIALLGPERTLARLESGISRLASADPGRLPTAPIPVEGRGGPPVLKRPADPVDIGTGGT